MTDTDTDPLLDASRQELIDRMPRHFERLDMNGAQLRALQTDRLRSLLAVAVERSPFHAARLAAVDASTVGLDDLTSLPVMTKTEMMNEHDRVVTDRRITTEQVEAHLEALTDTPALFLDQYVVLASGGGSGSRATVTYDRHAAVDFSSAVLRSGLRRLAGAVGWPPRSPVPLAMVAAPVCVHATRILPALVEGTIADVTYAPATLPFADMAERVEHAQPVVLVGYASAIARLADANGAGRLAINPQIVICTSEQLTPALNARITSGFGRPPVNSFGSTEGLIGTAPPGSDVFNFASDLAIVEFVDVDDQPVPTGEAAHHVLITNLFNHTQPLIRYRLDDVMTPAAPASGHGHRRASLEGRTDDYLDLPGTSVHPTVIRSLMVRHPEITDYQVHQDRAALSIEVVPNGDVALAALDAQITDALAAAGAHGVAVTTSTVDALRRNPRTGKVERFIR